MRRHKLDVAALIAGSVFVALAAGLAFGEPGIEVLRAGRWLLPIAGIVIGLALLGASLRGGRSPES